MPRITLLLVLLIATLMACSSDDVAVVETQGTVIDLGDPAADGCGWVIEIDGIQYSPTYLNAQYRQDGLSVFVTVEFLETHFVCGLAATEIDQIRVEQIRPTGN